MSDASGKSGKSVVMERDVPHAPEKVWRALTQTELLEQWLMKNDFAPAVGHRFKLRAPPMPKWDGVIACEVLAVEPHTRLSYSWGSLGLETVVTWTLTPTKTGTHVRMEQSGFPSEEGGFFKGAIYGWTKFLDGLDRVLGTLE